MMKRKLEEIKKCGQNLWFYVVAAQIFSFFVSATFFICCNLKVRKTQ